MGGVNGVHLVVGSKETTVMKPVVENSTRTLRRSLDINENLAKKKGYKEKKSSEMIDEGP